MVKHIVGSLSDIRIGGLARRREGHRGSSKKLWKIETVILAFRTLLLGGGKASNFLSLKRVENSVMAEKEGATLPLYCEPVWRNGRA